MFRIGDETIALVGELPSTANQEAYERLILGVYNRRSELVNGAPSYVKASGERYMLWHVSEWGWCVSFASNKGKPLGFIRLSSDKKRLEDAIGTWQVVNEKSWLDAPGLRLLRHVPPADEVSVVGERTRDQKDAEGRKRAIDLTEGTMETPRKRSRADDVETRVAKARSLCASEVAARARTLMQAHYQEFCDEKIDGAELERRRAAAREQAEKEHPPLSALDKAFAVYTAAAAAEQAAEAKREAAEATLEAALRALEKKGEAGPSGVKAEA